MNTFKLLLITGLTFLFYLSGIAQHKYDEPYRPQFHFSPEKGWIGDPCGLIYYRGNYQMFWWGKVTSTDLVYYKQESPKVMTGDDGTISYFTGSVAVDKNNTAVFGKDALIAAYTIFNKATKSQAQGISYSNDGLVFNYFKGNPVLDIGSTEFRDPTVFWNKSTSKWIMVVAKALEKKIKFYSSTDLKNWTWMSDFGSAGATEKAWECPDLFQLPVDGNTNNRKWVLVVSFDWAHEQYFVGDFDGTTFKTDYHQPKTALLVDRGLDFYASRTFRDYDHVLKSTTSIGWIATWDYAALVPSTWGKGFWSIPRDLELKTFPEGIRLIQKPIANLQKLRQSTVTFVTNVQKGTAAITKFDPKENLYELDAVFSTKTGNVFGLNLCVGDGRKVSFSYDTQTETLTIDRTNCSNVPIDKFSRTTSAKVIPVNKEIRMHFYVDKSSIELFTNEGKEVFTLLTYPAENQVGIETFAEKEGTKMTFSAWKLNSIWKQISK
jgi:fructan beta-fructosidase